MRKLLILLFSAVISFSFAQISTKKINPTETLGATNGVVYALPKALIRLDVWVEKTEHLKGPYSTYADRLLGISDIVSTDHETYKIRDIKMKSEYIADADQIYYLSLGEFSGKSDNVRFLQFDETGLLTGSTANHFVHEAPSSNGLVEQTKKGEKNFRYFADANLVEKVDTIIRRVDVDTATIEKAILKRYSIEKDISQRAQDAATYYMDIHKSRVELISGFQEVAYSAGTLGLMNSELKQLEDDYLALFAGKKLITDQHFVFYFTPASDQPNIIAPVFKFSEQTGLDYVSSSGGEKVSVAIKSNGLAENLMETPITGSVAGLVYRFPETAEVWVKYGSNEYDKQIMVIPQLGRLQKVQLDQNAFELYPESGAIKVLEIRK